MGWSALEQIGSVSSRRADYLTSGTSEMLICTTPSHLPAEFLMLRTVVAMLLLVSLYCGRVVACGKAGQQAGLDLASRRP